MGKILPLKPDARGQNTQTGKIVIWDDAKGFGWVESDEGRLFLHISEFEGRGRPLVLGEEIQFLVGSDVKGRPCGKSPTPFANAGRVSLGEWILLAALLVLPVLGFSRAPVAWWWPLLLSTSLSVLTYRLYAYDKMQAVRHGWRVQETSLHLAEIAGGWPGAFLAQRRLRHKCSKNSYRMIFWGIISLYQFAGLDFYLENSLSGDLWKMLGEGRVFG
jgi:uncharacterized membrane protein YsdA (DUF1294 family)/cold shock CspA family protein